MLIINEEQFLKEINSNRYISSTDTPDSVEVKEVIMENKTYDNFRKPEGANLPKPVKALIGALATEYSQKEVHEAFPVSLPTIANAENDNHNSEEVKSARENILDRIKEKSLKSIEQCVDFLDVSKATKNSELIAIAQGLSNVVEKITPKAEKDASPVQFVFYAPSAQNKVEDYGEIVEADK